MGPRHPAQGQEQSGHCEPLKSGRKRQRRPFPSVTAPDSGLRGEGKSGPVRHLRQPGGPPGGGTLTWGKACTTVSSRARIPVAIFSSFSTAGDTPPAHSAQGSGGARVRVCTCVSEEKGDAGGAEERASKGDCSVMPHHTYVGAAEHGCA